MMHENENPNIEIKQLNSTIKDLLSSDYLQLNKKNAVLCAEAINAAYNDFPATDALKLFQIVNDLKLVATTFRDHDDCLAAFLDRCDHIDIDLEFFKKAYQHNGNEDNLENNGDPDANCFPIGKGMFFTLGVADGARAGLVDKIYQAAVNKIQNFDPPQLFLPLAPYYVQDTTIKFEYNLYTGNSIHKSTGDIQYGYLQTDAKLERPPADDFKHQATLAVMACVFGLGDLSTSNIVNGRVIDLEETLLTCKNDNKDLESNYNLGYMKRKLFTQPFSGDMRKYLLSFIDTIITELQSLETDHTRARLSPISSISSPKAMSDELNEESDDNFGDFGNFMNEDAQFFTNPTTSFDSLSFNFDYDCELKNEEPDNTPLPYFDQSQPKDYCILTEKRKQLALVTAGKIKRALECNQKCCSIETLAFTSSSKWKQTYCQFDSIHQSIQNLITLSKQENTTPEDILSLIQEKKAHFCILNLQTLADALDENLALKLTGQRSADAYLPLIKELKKIQQAFAEIQNLVTQAATLFALQRRVDGQANVNAREIGGYIQEIKLQLYQFQPPQWHVLLASLDAIIKSTTCHHNKSLGSQARKTKASISAITS